MKSFLAIALALFSSAVLAAASPSGTVVVAPSTATITDAAGTVWSLNATAPCTATWAVAGTTGEVARSGVLDATTCQVVEIAYVSGVIYQLTSSGNWYPLTSSGGWGSPTTVSPLAAVAAPTTYTETLTWGAVVANLDGSVPVSISYNVYEGPSATTLGAAPISTGTTALTATYSLGGAGQTVCFAVTAVNDQGAESAQSAVACKTFAKAVPATPANVAVK